MTDAALLARREEEVGLPVAFFWKAVVIDLLSFDVWGLDRDP